MRKMKKQKKNSKKKPYKSMSSNMIWSIRKTFRYSPAVFFMQILEVPINVGISYAAIYLPSLTVAVVTEKRSMSYVLMTVGGLMLAILIAELFKKAFSFLIVSGLDIYCNSVTNELNRKSLGCFYQIYESKPMRDLLERALEATQSRNGVRPISDMPRQTWAIVESIICYFLFGTIISFVSPWLILILTVAPAVNVLAVTAYDNWRYRNKSKWANIDTRLNYICNRPGEFGMAKDIRIFGMTGWFTNIYHDLVTERKKIDSKQIWRYFLSRLADLAIILLRDGAAYALLIIMTLRGEITVDKFILYFAAISSFAGWIGNILNSWNMLRSASLSLCDLREYIEYPEHDGTGEEKIDNYLKSPPEITFDNVSFRYEGAEEDVIHEISFTINPGEKVALVGLNGAGKTTLVKLLCGLYIPTSGEIRINGTPISKFLRNDYYRLFSPVFQDIRTAFFSLAETVSCESESETDFTRAEKCIRLAGLSDKVDSLPEGIHTKLDKQANKNGIELSGGETQKLMLARAMYKNAPVLVLDEPTAALDPIAENEIYLNYNEISREKSSLFISHRLASTRFCDRIIYLKNGRITEEGTHDVLIKANGEYSRLYEMQSCWYREDDNNEA